MCTHGSASTLSGTAIGEAGRAIQGGYLDIALAGGAEAPLTADVLDVLDVVQVTRVLAHPDEHGVAQSCKSFHRKRESWCWAKAPPF